ncbi:MAG: cellulose biosynthesis protein BcsS [Xanthobacteraceae bacterium]|nr:MAG: cellulose biosynthesis protein BcsS [Xanthobacteraceae bacterium]
MASFSALPGSSPAHADGTPTTPASPARMLYFSGFDLWQSGGAVYLGAQWSPGGVEQTGFTLKLLLAEGSYRYRAGAAEIRDTNLVAAILPGWKFKRGNAELTLFAGLDAQQHWLSPDDPAATLSGGRLGLRGGADLWWEPNANMMVAASASASTFEGTSWIRWGAGWRVAGQFWAGPELQATGDRLYQQYRAGLHITGFRTGTLEWTAGGGFITDSAQGSGLYGRFGLLTRR